MTALLDSQRKRSRKAKPMAGGTVQLEIGGVRDEAVPPPLGREIVRRASQNRGDSVELVLPMVAFVEILTASTAKALTDWDREVPGQ
jgi:hypothetical protein